MDQQKVQAVVNWPQPTTLKELQCFLEFANFYRRFILNFSTVAGPMTSMVKKGTHRLSWSSAAITAFRSLKERFTTAPILHHPDPDLEFTVEVDASSTGIGAVLSQRQGNPPKLYPCAFFSRKLNPTEQNYDVGNCELLAMKAAFEEWRHWLEGARHSVIRVSQAHYNSSIISYGGPHSDLTLSRSFKTAPSVIPPSLCINYLLDSFNHCPFHNAPGRTWPLTL